MKFSKGTIRNVSKKIITGSLTLTLLMTSLTGCTKDLNYSKEIKSGHYVVEATGTMQSSIAEKLKVIELDVDGENILFLSRIEEKQILLKNGCKKYIYEYWDVFQNFKIISLTSEKETNPLDINLGIENIKFVKEESLQNYLQYYGYKNKEYTVDELKEIFNKIEKDYVKENNKQLIKGK